MEGKSEKYLIAANPKYKTVNVYNGTGKRIKLDDLKSDQKLTKEWDITKSHGKSSGMKM